MEIKINESLEKKIKDYCSLNEIDDIEAFVNRCCLNSLNILMFGSSPIDNVKRESKGIVDFVEEKIEQKPSISQIEAPQCDENPNVVSGKVTTRKVRVIKKK